MSVFCEFVMPIQKKDIKRIKTDTQFLKVGLKIVDNTQYIDFEAEEEDKMLILNTAMVYNRGHYFFPKYQGHVIVDKKYMQKDVDENKLIKP